MRTLNLNELRAVTVAGDGDPSGGDPNGGDSGGGPSGDFDLGWWQAPSDVLDLAPAASNLPGDAREEPYLPAPHYPRYERLWWDDMAMEPNDGLEAPI